ncbi:MAG: FIST C-terminal domain-containing protein [Dehalococcoidia bacterium]|nr:FIST C-terminal domain-containing protein [Dehalococcoidia bacterium]
MTSWSGLGHSADWRNALDEAIAARTGDGPDLLLAFASWHHREHFPAFAEALATELKPGLLLGCSAQAIVGTGTELEDAPAVSLLALDLPGAFMSTVRLEHGDFQALRTVDVWRKRIGVEPDDANAFIVLCDPFTFDIDALIALLEQAYPGVPVVGGMASGEPGRNATELFHDGEVLYSGAILVALTGEWTINAVVSQGAAPIGDTWTVTGVERNVVRSLGGRAPLEVLVDTVRSLPPEMQQRASRNLLIGLAMDEYRDEFQRGDFLIRNLVGVDQETGAVAVGAFPRVGQTLQFQVRDAAAADEELREMLDVLGGELGESSPAGALLCLCNGRGVGLFGEPHHDARAVRERFGPVPATGFFCNGEVGPVGGKNFVHGFTASIAFFVRNE